MKGVFLFSCLTISIIVCRAAVSFAGFTLPPHVCRIGSLKVVQEKARSGDVPIVFIYSNENTACCLAKEATPDVMEGLKGTAFIVYVTKNDSPGIPENVRKAMNSPEADLYFNNSPGG